MPGYGFVNDRLQDMYTKKVYNANGQLSLNQTSFFKKTYYIPHHPLCLSWTSWYHEKNKEVPLTRIWLIFIGTTVVIITIQSQMSADFPCCCYLLEVSQHDGLGCWLTTQRACLLVWRINNNNSSSVEEFSPQI